MNSNLKYLDVIILCDLRPAFYSVVFKVLDYVVIKKNCKVCVCASYGIEEGHVISLFRRFCNMRCSNRGRRSLNQCSVLLGHFLEQLPDIALKFFSTDIVFLFILPNRSFSMYPPSLFIRFVHFAVDTVSLEHKDFLKMTPNFLSVTSV